jgi:hypothetical protein
MQLVAAITVPAGVDVCGYGRGTRGCLVGRRCDRSQDVTSRRQRARRVAAEWTVAGQRPERSRRTVRVVGPYGKREKFSAAPPPPLRWVSLENL